MKQRNGVNAKIFSIGLVVCCLLFGTFGVANASLIAYYDFEGNANDTTGNGYDGSVYGATLTTGYNGSQGYAFDGINDYISIDLDINPTVLPQLTMGAWVSADKADRIRQVISHDNGMYDRTLGIDTRGEPGSSYGWSAFSGSGNVLGDFDIDLNQWTFIAVAYDQSTQGVMLYVNGNTMFESGNMGAGNTFVHIGNNPIGTAPGYEFFSGIVDNVFFYNESLTEEELDDIMLHGVSPVPEPATFLLLALGLSSFAASSRKKLSRAA